jgi:large subunit ribosomal protein L4
MATVDVIGVAGARTGSVELPADIFDVQANIPLMHQVVVAQLAAARQGTHKTKTRGEVHGGGRKPYKQKGTGRARQGSIRAPQFTGGGVVHGPVPRDHSVRVNKKMKAAALRGALSDRARAGLVHVVETFVDADTPRTKDALAVLNSVTDARRVLVVLAGDDEINWISLRNLPQVHLIEAGQLNTYDVLVADAVIFTAAALDEFLGLPAEFTAAPEADRGAGGEPTDEAPARDALAQEARTDQARSDAAGIVEARTDAEQLSAEAEPTAEADSTDETVEGRP